MIDRTIVDWLAAAAVLIALALLWPAAARRRSEPVDRSASETCQVLANEAVIGQWEPRSAAYAAPRCRATQKMIRRGDSHGDRQRLGLNNSRIKALQWRVRACDAPLAVADAADVAAAARVCVIGDSIARQLLLSLRCVAEWRATPFNGSFVATPHFFNFWDVPATEWARFQRNGARKHPKPLNLFERVQKGLPECLQDRCGEFTFCLRGAQQLTRQQFAAFDCLAWHTFFTATF